MGERRDVASASRARSAFRSRSRAGTSKTICVRTAVRGWKSARQRSSPLPLPPPPAARTSGSPRCWRSRASVTPSTRGKAGHATPVRTGLAHPASSKGDTPHGPRFLHARPVVRGSSPERLSRAVVLSAPLLCLSFSAHTLYDKKR